MEITNAQYLADEGQNLSIRCTIDGSECFVPIAVGNTEYDEIMRQVEAGELTIQEPE